MRTEDLQERVDAYLRAFNDLDLDQVMAYFAPESVYKPGDGTHYQGIPAIRQAFLPQFSRAWGTWTFVEMDRITDAERRKVVLVWDCRIDTSTACFYSAKSFLQITLGRLKFGRAAFWKGLDILTFDENGYITEKLTYANYKGLLFQPLESGQ